MKVGDLVKYAALSIREDDKAVFGIVIELNPLNDGESIKVIVPGAEDPWFAGDNWWNFTHWEKVDEYEGR